MTGSPVCISAARCLRGTSAHWAGMRPQKEHGTPAAAAHGAIAVDAGAAPGQQQQIICTRQGAERGQAD